MSGCVVEVDDDEEGGSCCSVPCDVCAEADVDGSDEVGAGSLSAASRRAAKYSCSLGSIRARRAL